MENTIKGALVQYGSDFLGPIPNVVVFQFNPEKMSRTIQIPERPVNATTRETSQAGEPPYEKFTIEAEFSAAGQRDGADVIGLTMGVGPQLAALEAMVFPVESDDPVEAAAVDAVGAALDAGGLSDPTQPIPRLQTPKILFVWGTRRIVPVIIESMTINEAQYDSSLNPVEATVSLGLAVVAPSSYDDQIGQGALAYTRLMQSQMAAANLVNTAALAVDLITF